MICAFILFIGIFSNIYAFPALNSSGLLIDNRIIGGEATTIEEFPFQVSFRQSDEHLCGGVIITKKHVLTAGHCYLLPNNQSVIAGVTNRLGDENQQIRKVIHMILHPKYGIGYYHNDIAVIFVDKKFEFNKFVQPIRLPQMGSIVKDDVDVIVTGWGSLDDIGTVPTILRFATISVVNNEKCGKVYPGKIWERVMCATPKEGRKGSCYGDSGGPLSFDGELIGLVSWAYGCAYAKFPTVYTRVSYYIDWINQTIH